MRLSHFDNIISRINHNGATSNLRPHPTVHQYRHLHSIWAIGEEEWEEKGLETAPLCLNIKERHQPERN